VKELSVQQLLAYGMLYLQAGRQATLFAKIMKKYKYTVES